MSKVKYIFEDGIEKAEFKFSETDFLDEQLNSVKNNGINSDDALFYHLFDTETKKFIVETKTIDSSKVYQMKNTSKYAISTVASLKGILKLFENTDNLNTKEANQLSQIVFFLKNSLEVDSFAEEFISYDGLKCLIEVVEVTKGNTRSYALDSLISLFNFKNANEYIKENPNVVQNMYYIIAGIANNINDAANTATIKNILMIFKILCEYLKDDGIDIIISAAETYSEKSGVKPFLEIVGFLAASEYLVKINVISLVTSMIRNSERKSKQAKVLSYFNEAGLTKLIMLDAESKVLEYQAELTNFQKATGEIISGSLYEIELYKARITEMENHVSNVEKKAEFVFLQQKYYSDIIEEFVTFQKMAEAAIEIGGYFDPSKVLI